MTIALGYNKRPGANADSFGAAHFARVISSVASGYYFIVGRIKDMIGLTSSCARVS
jgi:acyl-CoA synthetase (AMP-forming)/AMP-acid ligase II